MRTLLGLCLLFIALPVEAKLAAASDGDHKFIEGAGDPKVWQHSI